jgi:hypothetical protein
MRLIIKLSLLLSITAFTWSDVYLNDTRDVSGAPVAAIFCY